MGKHNYKCLACGREAKSASNVNYFNLPTCKERRASWLKSIKKPNLLHEKMSRDFKICDSHFSQEMYTKSMRRLKLTAVPYLKNLKRKANSAKGKSKVLRDIQMSEPLNVDVQKAKLRSTKAQSTRMSLKEGEPEVLVVKVDPDDIQMSEPIDIKVEEAKDRSTRTQSTPTSIKESEPEVLVIKVDPDDIQMSEPFDIKVDEAKERSSFEEGEPEVLVIKVDPDDIRMSERFDIKVEEADGGSIEAQSTPMSFKKVEAEVMVIKVDPRDIQLYDPALDDKVIPATLEEEAELLLLLDILKRELEAD